MFTRHPLSLTVLLLAVTPFLAWGQQVDHTSLLLAESSFFNRTFCIAEASGEHSSANDVHHYFVFQHDGRAIFRETRGAMVLKDSPLAWRLVGDSLYLIPNGFTIEAKGKTQRVEREAVKYAITKVSGGYLLKRKEEQMLLTKIK